MHRRHFTRMAGMGAAGLWFGEPATSLGPARQALEVDQDSLDDRMRTLATFGANAAGGIDRVAFSDANLEARDWVAELLENVGFDAKMDLAGNLVARKRGSQFGLRPIAFGSHID